MQARKYRSDKEATMTRIRAEFDADRAEPKYPTAYATAENSFPIPCSICGKDYYFDADTKNDIDRVWQQSGENPFVCPDCEDSLEDAVFGNAAQ